MAKKRAAAIPVNVPPELRAEQEMALVQFAIDCGGIEAAREKINELRRYPAARMVDAYGSIQGAINALDDLKNKLTF